MLRRRLAFLGEPSSYFYDGDTPLRVADVDDPFRKGVLLIARATSRTEPEWLPSPLDDLTAAAAADHGPQAAQAVHD
ncbi:hypothetical protein GCM10010502_64690 [Kitasatospora aureofaciens]|uniref:Uncharacterized protein n=1 Tax=Kitasatospora aureofaciens TaxID=1894 RepID=A0A8H9LU26_KITAU|nr:hypothetical protein GCM10010502_64690 [Kitasatospora aureofaciens]